ncbi:hypothetical protein DSL64_07800 [Dyadobacter luteus]|uniref:SnoaL-like domain-containing protein n=2 Tax=Dyadobacter luteus TaxID=2259619 RepID=A0A3D8YE79_9BACT|nr:hypothetical protein DSL64_07800 [Dyadobacter luteus]
MTNHTSDTLLHHSQTHESCVSAYLSVVWNNGFTDQMAYFVHPLFVDYSMPFSILQNADGVKTYLHILKTSLHFHLEIESLASCGDFVYASTRLHVAPLHLVSAQTTEVSMQFSIFQMNRGMIIAHWQA